MNPAALHPAERFHRKACRFALCTALGLRWALLSVLLAVKQFSRQQPIGRMIPLWHNAQFRLQT